jgi:beta-mannanase
MLRFGHEFNGNWYPWSLDRNGRLGSAYVNAFRRVVTRLRAAGARRVQHVWCFNRDSQPAEPWNDPRAAYPGDDVVDWIGIDGYNFGTSQSWSRWTVFRDLFAHPVALANDLSPRKPIVLAEMGCSETGGDKAEWITRMAADFAQMPSVRAFTWFDIVKETSWSLTSSDASWLAAIHALRQPHIRGNGTALLAVAASRP